MCIYLFIYFIYQLWLCVCQLGEQLQIQSWSCLLSKSSSQSGFVYHTELPPTWSALCSSARRAASNIQNYPPTWSALCSSARRAVSNIQSYPPTCSALSSSARRAASTIQNYPCTCSALSSSARRAASTMQCYPLPAQLWAHQPGGPRQPYRTTPYLLSSELISQAGRVNHAVLGLLISQPRLPRHLI